MHVRLKHTDEEKFSTSSSSSTATFASPSTQAIILPRVSPAPQSGSQLGLSTPPAVSLQQLQSLQQQFNQNQSLQFQPSISSLQSLQRQLTLSQPPVNFSPAEVNENIVQQLKHLQQLQFQQMQIQSIMPTLTSIPPMPTSLPSSIPSLPLNLGPSSPLMQLPNLLSTLSPIPSAPINVSTSTKMPNLSPISVPAETIAVPSSSSSPKKRLRLSPTVASTQFVNTSFFIEKICVGSWIKGSESFGDLVGRFALLDRRVYWESITADGIFRISAPFDDIASLKLNGKTIECALSNPASLSLGQFARLEDSTASQPEQQQTIQNLWIQGIDFGPDKLLHTIVVSHLPTTIQELYKMLSQDQHLQNVIKIVGEETTTSTSISSIFDLDQQKEYNPKTPNSNSNLLLSNITIGSGHLQSLFNGDMIGVISVSQRTIRCESITTERILRVLIPFVNIELLSVEPKSSTIQFKLRNPPDISLGIVPGSPKNSDFGFGSNTKNIQLNFLLSSIPATALLKFFSQDPYLREAIGNTAPK
jgi:hypothetical protein